MLLPNQRKSRRFSEGLLRRRTNEQRSKTAARKPEVQGRLFLDVVPGEGGTDEAVYAVCGTRAIMQERRA